jgi:rfaE bifunctional protein nucleotidyltransferase chain/domain
MGQVLNSVAELQAAIAKQPELAPVVTTNGCFDLLHVGHLRYLQAARVLGNSLVVLVNSDASVNGLKSDAKGPPRPLVPQAERAELLAGLACVDFVLIFDTPTPEPLLEAIRPDIHVKGGQYTLESLPEAPLLQRLGTQIRFIDMVPGRSTSNLVAQIMAAGACG